MNDLTIRPIRSDADHSAALAQIEALWGADPDTPESDALDVLVDLVEAYEARSFVMPDVPPLEYLQAHMEAHGFGQSDLASVLGSRSRASEILSGRRSMSIDMIRKIALHWNASVEGLVGRLEAA